jgi:hypothetical protein
MVKLSTIGSATPTKTKCWFRKWTKKISNTQDGSVQSPQQQSITPQVTPQVIPQVGVEIDEDGDGVMDGIDEDGDGIIDMYFEHRQCEHVWGDKDGDGEEECLKCGLIKQD